MSSDGIDEMETASAYSLVACHECDLLYRKPALREGERAKCFRCGAVLYRKKRDSLERTLTFSLTGLILFMVANGYPFMTFKLEGRIQESILFTGVMEFYLQGFWPLAVLVFAASIFFPLVKIVGTLYVLLPLKWNRQLWKSTGVFRFVTALTPWAMMEVYMLGVFVAYVKLIDLARIELGVALYAFSALIVVQAAAGAALDHEEIWGRLKATR